MNGRGYPAIAAGWRPVLQWFSVADARCPCKAIVAPLVGEWMAYADELDAGAPVNPDDLARQLANLRKAIATIQKFAVDDPRNERPALPEGTFDVLQRGIEDMRHAPELCRVGDPACRDLRAGANREAAIHVAGEGDAEQMLVELVGPQATGWTPGWAIATREHRTIDGRCYEVLEVRRADGTVEPYWFDVSAYACGFQPEPFDLGGLPLPLDPTLGQPAGGVLDNVPDFLGKLAQQAQQGAQQATQGAFSELGAQAGKAAGQAAGQAAVDVAQQAIPQLAQSAGQAAQAQIPPLAQSAGQAVAPMIDPLAQRAGTTAGRAAGKAAAETARAELASSWTPGRVLVGGLLGAAVLGGAFWFGRR